jgi:Ca2+-binding EF-hand superfamily protein
MASQKAHANRATHDDQASTNYKEAFSLFDKRGTGRVPLESLGDLLRACGQNPTMAEIRDLEKTVGGPCKTSLYALCSKRSTAPDG